MLGVEDVLPLTFFSFTWATLDDISERLGVDGGSLMTTFRQ